MIFSVPGCVGIGFTRADVTLIVQVGKLRHGGVFQVGFFAVVPAAFLVLCLYECGVHCRFFLSFVFPSRFPPAAPATLSWQTGSCLNPHLPCRQDLLSRKRVAGEYLTYSVNSHLWRGPVPHCPYHRASSLRAQNLRVVIPGAPHSPRHQHHLYPSPASRGRCNLS